MQPYRHYTFYNYESLPKIGIDKKNLTRHDRTLEDYSIYVATLMDDLQETILRDKKITILDCGAGSGRALDDLLSGPFKRQIKKCVGISLHYFDNVCSLFPKHRNKIEWYIGKAEQILPRMNEKFDLIFDIYGAYFYSPERPALINEYHRLLSPEGKANIYILTLENNFVKGDKKCTLEHHHQKMAPETFDREGDIFSIRKKSDTFPVGEITLSQIVKYSPSIPNFTGNEEKFKKGNAWYPQVVCYN